jgi:hypothetical protein
VGAVEKEMVYVAVTESLDDLTFEAWMWMPLVA